MNVIYYSSTEAAGEIITVIVVAIVVITIIIAIITATIRARRLVARPERGEPSENRLAGRIDGRGGERGKGETSSPQLYLHKIVVADASEDNEMKLNK
jgi:NhaP-type Na+/H+ or K+/H+ antiporter